MTYREDGALLDAYAGLYNLSTGAGTGRDKSLNFEVNYQAQTITREACETLFKTSGLVQKIVALLPEESPIEWYSLNLGKDTTAPQDVINDLEDRLQLHEKLVEASVLARLHHNAYIVILGNDGRTPDQPLDEDNLEEIVGLKVLSSYELQPSAWGVQLGGHSLIEPEHYDLIGLWELNRRLPDEQKFPIAQARIHKSRVLKFSGRKLYGWMLQSNQGRDLSILQSIVIAFSSYMQSVMASSGMVQDYSVFTYKLKGLSQMILQGQSDAIIRRFLAIQMGMSYNKGLAMDAENEDANFVSRQYGGVGDIVDRLKHLLTAESGIPHTKLWGEGSQGNTSGQSEKYDYADALESFQRHNWLKPTKQLVRLSLLSKLGVTKGKLPKGWKLVTKSSMRLDMEAEAKLRQTQARTDQVYRLMGVLHPMEIRKNRFGSPEWTMETTLDPDIDKSLWKMKESPEFLLPVLSGKPTAMAPTGEKIGEKTGAKSTGIDIGTKLGQAAIAGTGGDGGNNAEMGAQEADRDRMAENRRTDEKAFRYDGSTVKKRLRWGDRTLAIEYLPGDIRHNLRMEGCYGYIQKHTGHDNEPLDFYCTTEFYEQLNAGEQPKGKIFEIYQLKANADDPLERKSLDETKVLLGCNDLREATDLYLAHMPEEFLGLINDLTPEELRHYRYRRDAGEFREDLGKKKPSTPDVGGGASSPKRRAWFNPNQTRGKNGRWVETGAENRRRSVTMREQNPKVVDPNPGQTIQARTESMYRYKIGETNKKSVGQPVTRETKEYPIETVEPDVAPLKPEAKSRAEQKAKAATKNKRQPTVRKVVNEDSFEVTAEGRVEIWRNSEDKKFHETFKFKTNRDYEYKVEHEGQEIVLNRHSNAIEMHGERVNGVPSYYPNLREMPSERLINSMAKTMSLVEDKSNQPEVPEWKPTYHGKIDKNLVRSQKGIPGDYGKMQIHHMHQWSRARFDEITNAVKSGAKTLDEARNQMRELLVEDPSKKGIGYSIKLEKRTDREMVIVPEGAHSFTSPLYRANHPYGIHPDTGKEVKFGIPEEGDSGRDWFNKTFRPDFWREYYRRYSFVAMNEVNRRIRSGDLTAEAAQELWNEARQKSLAYRKYLKSLRKAD